MTCHIYFLCEIDDAIQNINLGCGAQAPKIVISAFFRHFVLFLSFRSFFVLASFSCHIYKVYFIFKSFFQVLLNFPVIYSSFLNNYIIMVK